MDTTFLWVIVASGLYYASVHVCSSWKLNSVFEMLMNAGY